MAEKIRPAKPAPPRPVPPPLELYAEVGDAVLWYPGADPDEHPHAAVVAKLGHGHQVVANVFDSSLMGVTPQDGCRHMSDPMSRTDNTGGGWRRKPLDVAAMRMLLTMGLIAWAEQPDGSFRLVETDPVQQPSAPPAAAPAA